jgi:hypothetical protein
MPQTEAAAAVAAGLFILVLLKTAQTAAAATF